MQEAQASCNGGGSGLPDILPTSPHVNFPRRPSFSLQLYDRFVQDNSDMASAPHNLMVMDIDIPDSTPGVPPSADDAILASVPLSSRPSINAPRDVKDASKTKNPGKREPIDDPRLINHAKKPASADLTPSDRPSFPGQRSTQPSSSSSSLPPAPPPSAIVHRYNSKDLPPFVVQVQSTQESGLSHPLHISRIVSQIFPREILETKKIGRNKILVQTNTYEAANRLASNSSLASHNLSAFIPSYKVLRAGIVRDVPQDFPVDHLNESISSPIKILEIHRLNRRLKVDNEVRYVASRTICLKFAGQSLPRYIYLFNCRYPVLPFIPKTRICFLLFQGWTFEQVLQKSSALLVLW